MQFPIHLLIAGAIVVLSWILNLTTICAMKSISSKRTIIYGYLTSLCIANLFLATINFPPSTISNILISKSFQHVMCVSWIYLDTLLCNVTVLILLGSCLDGYLRLQHSDKYQSSNKQVLTYFKLSAPWTLGFIQSTAFMAISHISETSLDDGICYISDPNFLILRSVMCFGLPISGSAVLVFLSAKGLSYDEQPTKERSIATTKHDVDQGEHSLRPTTSCMFRRDTHDTMMRPFSSNHYGHLPQSLTFDCGNSMNYYQHQCPRHGVLSLPITTTLPHDSSLCICHPNSNMHCPDLIPFQDNEEKITELIKPDAHRSNSSIDLRLTTSDRRNLPSSQSLDIQRMYNNWSSNANQNLGRITPIVIKDRRTILSQERNAVALNLALCIFTIIFWGPFIIGSLIQGVCKPPYCIIPISNARINEFKWISYVLCLVYPMIFIAVDLNLRTEIRTSLSC